MLGSKSSCIGAAPAVAGVFGFVVSTPAEIPVVAGFVVAEGTSAAIITAIASATMTKMMTEMYFFDIGKMIMRTVYADEVYE
jgi:hypothetical protein